MQTRQTSTKPVNPTQIQPGTDAPPPKLGGACSARPLDTRSWSTSWKLTIHEATTCRYRARWNVPGQNCHGTWPREYDFKADEMGWISDSFIRGCNDGARVHWNLRTNQVLVTARDGGDVDEATARRFAHFAKTTIFPGIDMNNLIY